MRLLLHDADTAGGKAATWDFMSDRDAEWPTIAHIEEHYAIDVPELADLEAEGFLA